MGPQRDPRVGRLLPADQQSPRGDISDLLGVKVDLVMREALKP
jgi:hypothetical protein